MEQYTTHPAAGADVQYAQLFDSMGREISYSTHDAPWSSLDPRHGSDNLYPPSTPYDFDKYLVNQRRDFAPYDRVAHGFGLAPTQVQASDENIYQLGISTAWHDQVPDIHPSLRYVSPFDGVSLRSASSCAGSDSSTFSDYPFSPELEQGGAPPMPYAPPLNLDMAPRSVSDNLLSPHSQSLNTRHMLSPRDFQRQLHDPTGAPTSFFYTAFTTPRTPSEGFGSPQACSLKDLDLHNTPNYENEDTNTAAVDIEVNDDDVEMVTDADITTDEIRIKKHEPEEVNAAHTDSGIGPSPAEGSIDLESRYDVQDVDEAVHEDEDEDVSAELDEVVGTVAGNDSDADKSAGEDEDGPQHRQDDDSDFTPKRRNKHARTTLSVRSSVRTPKRPQQAVQDMHARIHKPKSTPRRQTHTRTVSSASSTKLSSRPRSSPPQATRSVTYRCPFTPFGCLNTFSAKNEWKRHTSSQHLSLGFWRCDIGVCNWEHQSGLTKEKGYNEFRRKDLFVQHVRRMHEREWRNDQDVAGEGHLERGMVMNEEDEELKGTKKARAQKKTANKETDAVKEAFNAWIEDLKERCWIHQRDPPSWCVCGICGHRFEDVSCAPSGTKHASTKNKTGGGAKVLETVVGKAWEEKMEHVARHYEKGGERLVEGMDDGLREWGEREGVIADGVLIGLNREGGEVKGRGKRKTTSGVAGRGNKSRNTSGYTLRHLRDENEEEVHDDEKDTQHDDTKVIEKEEDGKDEQEEEDDDTDAEGEIEIEL